MIAYGQGKSVVDYLIDLYGTDAMARLMKELRNELSIDRALMKVYGFDQAGLDSDWRKSIGMNPIEANASYQEDEAPEIESTQEPKLIENNLSGDEILSDDNSQSTSPSCNKSVGESTSVQTDSFLLLLMLGPIGLLPIRNRTRFWRK